MDVTVGDSGMSKSKDAVPKSIVHGSSCRTLRKLPSPRQNPLNVVQRILQEELFLGMLCLERKRAERSGKGFFLVLIDSRSATENSRQMILKGMIRAANAARRETDLAGWYKQESVLGIIFTELGPLQDSETNQRLLKKIHEALDAELQEDIKLLNISFQFFPDDATLDDDDNPPNPSFYPDLLHQSEAKTVSVILKRVIDIIGSAAAILLFSPLFLFIVLMVKLTSKGPVLFKQERLGQFGKTFTFLKFRSMYANNDSRIHKEFMKRLIKGANDGKTGGESKPAFKMRHDPRVTPLGRFLRRTSMDELPQFINVLKGEMSLVGPRPPIPYEYKEYHLWHRRRVLEIKPGITGLWQVKGRSRVGFDDIVRLDLQYARAWSLWLDLQILAQTPRAVLLGDGAY